MRRSVLVATFVVITLAACNTEKRHLLARIAELERQQTAQNQRTERRRNTVLDLERRLDTINGELTQYNSDVHAYVFRHRTAAACIRATNITLGGDDDSGPIAGAAGWGTLLCTVALLDRRFAQEVTETATRLEEAGRRRRELKDKITGVQRTIDIEQSRLRDDESELDRVASEIAEVRYQLSLQ